MAQAVQLGIPVPAMSSALAFYDGYRHARLPANLIQAQRDYFGAHTYERVDQPARQILPYQLDGHRWRYDVRQLSGLTATVIECRGFGAYPQRTYLKAVEYDPRGLWLPAAFILWTAVLIYLERFGY